jgi:hypothetical protein
VLVKGLLRLNRERTEHRGAVFLFTYCLPVQMGKGRVPGGTDKPADACIMQGEVCQHILLLAGEANCEANNGARVLQTL